ncbi:2-oxoacid-dependent dioxygenase [Selaginella moellendorffii]|uniref:2-oxoacid-dependent dioxygenase n=1 Tax=Selaginella moellendorffii TaxID=88036 RepID=D8SR07_SELML|nr:protein DOWNY MILDEW RESISTANCE 6 [Selaginella moellendorffii]EFJ12958.1 2-oxoacid-dependent dioxygenase [Selaginella moellendorffii]|eukprot:XP_002985781.1 protein DOWNY MILDEW RESISTANCE 6 [Selaginella moellendorffii]
MARVAPEENYLQDLKDRFQEAEVLDDSQVPIIDFSGDPKYIVDAIAWACQEWGFFQAINHGVPIASMKNVLKLAKEIFNQTSEENEAYNSLGNKLSDDPSEAYRYGSGFNDRKDAKAIDLKYFLRLDYSLAREEDIWPESPSCFREVMKEYHDQVSTFGHCLLDNISKGLGLEKSYDLKVMGEKIICIMNYYLPYHTPELVKGVSAHSDPRAISILIQDDVGGLEVCKHGRWFAVKPVKDAFVVNIADQLQIMTNAKYKSAEHRVRAHPEKSRLSVVAFFGPGMDTVVGPLPEIVSEENPPLYRECVTKDYLTQFYANGLDGKRSLDYVKLDRAKV